MHKSDLDALISKHENGDSFSAQVVTLSQSDCQIWVRFKVEPNRFLPKIFDGEWAHTHLHPKPGEIRLIRIITGSDEISRVIGRQDKHLFAYPWFK